MEEPPPGSGIGVKSGPDAVGFCAQLAVLGAGEVVVSVEERP